jgi:NAD(P)-dependent dehydrogenase (short-subunit alcohol dehydrogenase family)
VLQTFSSDSSDQDVWALAISKAETLGTLNILVQCAGIPGRASLLDTTIDDWNRVFAINTTAVMYGMQVFIKGLLASGSPGSIVNVSSLAGVVTMGGGFAYEASKAACTHMSKTVAFEYGPKGIRANCVAPGLTVTGACLRARS